MESEEMKQKEMERVFGRKNYVILLVGLMLIVTGYILMSGEGSTLAAYNPDIFSVLRIRIAPVLCLLGYLMNVFGLLYHSTQSDS